ncbi:hypothetical protein ACOSQ4_020453 [Xanthoceras sorbifolium]
MGCISEPPPAEFSLDSHFTPPASTSPCRSSSSYLLITLTSHNSHLMFASSPCLVSPVVFVVVAGRALILSCKYKLVS